jgi:hypothetical protein
VVERFIDLTAGGFPRAEACAATRRGAHRQGVAVVPQGLRLVGLVSCPTFQLPDFVAAGRSGSISSDRFSLDVVAVCSEESLLAAGGVGDEGSSTSGGVVARLVEGDAARLKNLAWSPAMPSASSDAVRLIGFYLVGEQEPHAPNHDEHCDDLKRDNRHEKTGNTQRVPLFIFRTVTLSAR